MSGSTGAGAEWRQTAAATRPPHEAADAAGAKMAAQLTDFRNAVQQGAVRDLGTSLEDMVEPPWFYNFHV